MDNQTLATELLRELKASNRRWFIAFLIALTFWIATIGVFIWYISLPVDEITVDQYTDGDTNSIVGVGDLYGNTTESYQKTQSEAYS